MKLHQIEARKSGVSRWESPHLPMGKCGMTGKSVFFYISISS